MKIFELFAIHPFSSLSELEEAYHDAINKCDRMEQANINALTSAFKAAEAQLKVADDLLGLIQSTDDLIYVLNQFPKYARQIILTLDGKPGLIDFKQIMNAFTRCAIIGSSLLGLKVGLISALSAASAKVIQQGHMFMDAYSPLARLVFSDVTNFQALMTQIEPSLILLIGFILCKYPTFEEMVKQFEDNNITVKKVLNVGKDFVLGSDLSGAAILSPFWTNSKRENTRHLLAYVMSMHQLECECYAMDESQNKDLNASLTKLFDALKVLLMCKMQCADMDTLQSNQVIMNETYHLIGKSFFELSQIASPQLLAYIQQNLPFAIQVQFQNAILSQAKPELLKQGLEDSLAVAYSGCHDDSDSFVYYDTKEKEDEDEEHIINDELSIIDENTFVYVDHIDTNPFNGNCDEILTKSLVFIDNTLDNYKKIECFRNNPNLVVKGLYLLEIKNFLETLRASHVGMEAHREDIQAYCHLLQYVTNIETGPFSSCTSILTESIDQRTPVRLTGTKTHENLIDLFYHEFMFSFSEDLETKKSFLTYVAERQSAQSIIQKLDLGKEPKMDNMHTVTPKQCILKGAASCARHLSIQTLISPITQEIIWDGLVYRFRDLWPNSFSETVDLVINKLKK